MLKKLVCVIYLYFFFWKGAYVENYIKLLNIFYEDICARHRLIKMRLKKFIYGESQCYLSYLIKLKK
jgi:hypothetical protein